MNDEQTFQILDLIHTMQEACLELHHHASTGRHEAFHQLCGDMRAGLTEILKVIHSAPDTVGAQKLRPACESILDSLRRIVSYFGSDNAYCLQKIEFELLPLLQQAYLTYYFFQYLLDHPEHLPEYHAKERNLLCCNTYIDDAIAAGTYKYDLSIAVIGYNKLAYTKRCVESLLANLPAGVRYEIILVNHGSSDGTKEYFESVHPHKQLDIAVNGGGSGALFRIVEGEFTLTISNDVVVMPRAIDNLLACIRSDKKIAWAVPTTPNISNLQTIPAEYTNEEELLAFARRNNRRDPFRWEQRVRLCNPIDIRRNDVFCASDGLGIVGYFHTTHPAHCNSFPDDRNSLLLRRNGYKLMLVKDAYCHHFGSVTLKDEIKRQDEQKYYMDGRKEFFRAFHVDPWGTGFCYDPVFMGRIVDDCSGHTEILGINCGLGSNPLRIKEQLKEYCHNLDVRLSNIVSDPRFLADLAGVSDEVQTVSRLKELKQYLIGKKFHYIVWEDAFLPEISGKILLRLLEEALVEQGVLLVKKTEMLSKLISAQSGWDELGGGWFRLKNLPAEP